MAYLKISVKSDAHKNKATPGVYDSFQKSEDLACNRNWVLVRVAEIEHLEGDAQGAVDQVPRSKQQYEKVGGCHLLAQVYIDNENITKDGGNHDNTQCHDHRLLEQASFIVELVNRWGGVEDVVTSCGHFSVEGVLE